MLTALKNIIFFTCLMLSSAKLYAQLLNNSSSDLLGNNSAALSTSAVQSVLPADSAFALSAYLEAPNTLLLRWDIEDGYYLYQKSLNFIESNNNSLQKPVIPMGVHIEDEFFGEVEVYYQQLLIRIPFDNTVVGDNISLQLNYQGCAADSYCYPMQYKELKLEII